MTIKWFFNLETQTTKANQLTKNFVHIVNKTIMVFQVVIKNNVMKAYQRYQNQSSRTPQQSFVQYFRSKPSNSQENRN